MSDKAWDKLEWMDRELRQVSPLKGMDEGVAITITLRHGFELFNTRPYHNYETWSNGWDIEGSNGVKVSREDLDDAVRAFVAACKSE